MKEKCYNRGFFPQFKERFRATMLLQLVLVLGITLCMAGTAFAQTKKVTLDVKNASLEEIIKELKKQTEVKFLYSIDNIANKKASITVTNADLRDVLKDLFEQVNLTYEENKGVIIIHQEGQKNKSGKADNGKLKKITGTVKDNNGEPLPGATVLIKGTTKGTTTDVNGNYAINVPEGSVLEFSFIGYQKQLIVVSAQKTEINVTMEDAVAELKEFTVVSTGYQKIKPEQSTGSIATIQAKEYDSRINGPDFLTSLENRIPGLLINGDVEFEGNSLFHIRGISTINGNKDPLIVIDGFPTELKLESINPYEIESITVLKDAAAATVYGVRASNGVIVIERKKAKAGDVKVNFRSTISLKPKTDYERYRYDKDASEHIPDYMINNYTSSASTLYFYMTYPTLAFAFTFPEPVLILAEKTEGLITADEAEERLAALKSYNNTGDYGDYFLRNIVTQTYNLDISGGSEKALYYVTANYNTNKSEQVTKDNSRFRLSARGTFKFSDRFSLMLNLDFQEAKSNSSPIPSFGSIYPFERFEDEDGNPEWIYSGSVINPYYNEQIMAQGLYDNMYYPLVDMNEITNKTHTLTNSINATFRYDLGHGFNVNFGGVYQSSITDNDHLATEESSEVRQYINRYAQIDDDELIYNIPKGSFLKQTKQRQNTFTLRAQLNYDRKITEDHSLNMILGGEMRKTISKSSISSYFGYNDQTLLQQPVDYDLITTSYTPSYANYNPSIGYTSLFNQSYNDDRFISIYSNLIYSYKSKYSLSGSFRIDQSNLFGTNPKYKYKPLWSVGTAWNIHKENFMQNVDWVGSLKLRAALGFNGNVAKNSLPRIIATDKFNSDYNDMQALSLSSPANTRLRWEQTFNINFGLDYNIFEHISGSVEYYIKKSTDVLATNKIDPTSGVSSALINQSSIRNSGLEISLNADWLRKKHFNWNTALIFSHNSSKILEVYNDEVTATSKSYSYTMGNTNYLEGYPIGTIFNYRYAGLDPEDGQVLIYAKDGSTKHFDEDDAGIDDVVYRGTSIPAYTLGLSNRVDVGKFYFYAMIKYYGGFKTKIPVPNPSSTRPLEGAFNYWKEPGDELDPTMLPNKSQLTNGYAKYIGALDKYTVDGSYITLGDVTVSYSFKGANFMEKVGISNLELRLQASNIYTVAFNKQNYSKAMGSYEKSYITPTYTFALNLNF